MNGVISSLRLNEAIAQRSPVLVANMETGVIIWASLRVHKMFGYLCVNELEGMTVEDLIPQDKREGHIAFREAFNKNPTPMYMNERRILVGLRRDGSTFHLGIQIDTEKIGDQRLAFLVIIDMNEPMNQSFIASS